MIKNVITVLLTSFLMIGVANASDKNWKTSEHNFNIESGDWGLQVRTYGNDDYDHVEVSNKVADNVTVALRVAEDGANTEYRPKLTHKIFADGPISLAHRIEYRYFEGNTTDDYWRYRGIVKLSADNLWLTAQPRWTFGGDKKNDTKIDDVKWQAGYDWVLSESADSKVVFTPFVEYLQNGESNDWTKQHLIAGTTLKVKF